MGAVYCSIPTKLATDLRQKYDLKAFVESGLAQGTSALWAEYLFSTVVSIEIDIESIVKFRARNTKSNVVIIAGNSAIEMIQVVCNLKQPALFWLDGHTDDYTPVLAELAAFNLSPLAHVLMIDDWRMFGTCAAWPSKDNVLEFATNGGKRFAYDVDDVLVALP